MIVALGIVAIFLLINLLVAWISVHPFRTPVYLGPEMLEMEAETLQIPSEFELRAWWCPAPNAKGTIVWVHGYMMNRAELLPSAAQLYKRGYNALLIDLRAHGQSRGKICSLGVREADDVTVAAKLAKELGGDVPIILSGSSMGSAASLIALSRDPSLAQGAILDSCFSQLKVAGLGWWRFLGGNWLAVALSPTLVFGAMFAKINPFKIDLAELAPNLGEMPVLYLHGTRDALAPLSEAERNVNATQNAKLVTFEGSNHSDFRWFQTAKYFQTLHAFIDEFEKTMLSSFVL